MAVLKTTEHVGEEPEVDDGGEGEEEYVIEAIKCHTGKKDTLRYLISWVGWPGSDTWLPARDVIGSPVPTTAYWATKSKEAYEAALGLGGEVVVAEEEEAEEGEMVEAASGTAGGEGSEVDGVVEGGGGGSEKEEGEEEEEEEEVVVEQQVEEEGPAKLNAMDVDVDRPPPRRAEEPNAYEFDVNSADVHSEDKMVEGRYYEGVEAKFAGKEFDWEVLVEKVDGLRKLSKSGLLACLFWTDGSYSWIPSSIVRIRCPEKLLSYYENLIVF